SVERPLPGPSRRDRTPWRPTNRDTIPKSALGGYDAQEIVGVDAPVVYRAYYTPDGKYGNPAGWFSAHDMKDSAFDVLTARVKELTGREFASFQGKYAGSKEPFVVTPGAR
ncbi:MAG TPA: hypothetical protein VKE74_07005, partial [Gemmataceae bacterium]|nr:hypothetical protein [Gemmataceae bacterium]